LKIWSYEPYEPYTEMNRMMMAKQEGPRSLYRHFICAGECSREVLVWGGRILLEGFYSFLRASFIRSRVSWEREPSDSSPLLSRVNERMAVLMKSICFFASGQSLHIRKWIRTPIL
jgi:hypothetical protein